MMKKWIAGLIACCLLLSGATAAMAHEGRDGKHGHHGKGHHHWHGKKDVERKGGKSFDFEDWEDWLEKCRKLPPGLLNALNNVKNKNAASQIQANIQKHLKKCKAEDDGDDDRDDRRLTDQEKVKRDKKQLKIGFSGKDTAHSVTGPLSLPATGKQGSVIAWNSNKPDVISHDGKTVKRPSAGDVEVVLTATLRLNQAVDTKTFRLTVKGHNSAMTDVQKVAADKAALQIGFAEGDSAGHVTRALTLPTAGANGSVIQWYSGSPSVISNDGKILKRPATGSGDETVILIAVISNGTAADVKLFQLVVKSQLTDAQRVAADKARLEIDFGGSDTANRVTRPFDSLPAKGVNGSTIVWTSSNPDIISHDGKKVNRPAVNAADATVIMTAHISSGSVSDVKVFVLTVKKAYTARESLAADKADLAIGFAEGDSAGSVTKPIKLPTNGYYGSTVVWYSNAPTVISHDGKVVNRPARGSADVKVIMTAYISNGGIGDAKTFELTVKALP